MEFRTDTLGIIAPHPPIMVPEVGGTRAAVTAASASAMQTAAALLARFEPDAVVIMSPHAPVARDALLVDTSEYVSGDLGGFDAPEVAIDARGDPELAHAILQEAATADVRALARGTRQALSPGELDHGVLVPMSFLDRRGVFPLVVASLSYVPYEQHRAFGRAVRSAAARLGRRVAFVASGDCSHRLTPDAAAGFSPRARDFDAELARLLGRGAYADLAQIDPALIEAAGECGLRSFIALGGFLEGTGAVTRVLAYEGPWGVGYLTAVAADPDVITELDAMPAAGAKGGRAGEAESAPVALARRSIESWVREGVQLTDVPVSDPLLATRAGAFVSIHENGDLRGCIGTILPTRTTLAEEIAHNAVEAATRDPRFPPITPVELPALEITVDVLHAPEQISSLEQLDPKKYGVIVSCGWKRGLLLPDLEGVESCEHQVAIAAQKAGIKPGEKVELERFRVDRYE